MSSKENRTIKRYVIVHFLDLPKSLEIRRFTLCNTLLYTLFCPPYFVTLYSIFVNEPILIKISMIVNIMKTKSFIK